MLNPLAGKRLLDLAGAAATLVVASPVLGLAALLVRVLDGSPVLFRQPRLGLGRRPFPLVKLRTMTGGRVTRLGKVLRELGIDELPQLMNVLRGEMSLVGPRPLTAQDVSRLGWDGPRFDARWTVRPGLTGAAQVAPCRRCHQRTTWRLDHRYTRAAGAPADLRILTASLLVPLLGKARARGAARALTPELPVKVLVAGAGNLGTTLTNLLLAHRQLLGIDEVLLRKVRDTPTYDAPELARLAERGARVVRAAAEPALRQLLASVDYVFDCRKEGAALRDRSLYQSLANLRGVCAQGSETGFGPPFVGGINPGAAVGARLLQIASCNTHATATLLATLAGPRLENLDEADLVCVRRCDDLGARERLVGASVVARHRDGEHGTHHATDAARVFATLDLAPAVTSSDVTTPTQLMHAVRFHLRLRQPRTAAQLVAALEDRPHLATTAKFDSNRVFELGRRYGFQGRLYAHAVVVANDLHVRGPAVRGWAFVPQEGNTLLSTLEAFLRQTRHPGAEAVIGALNGALVERTF